MHGSAFCIHRPTKFAGWSDEISFLTCCFCFATTACLLITCALTRLWFVFNFVLSSRARARVTLLSLRVYTDNNNNIDCMPVFVGRRLGLLWCRHCPRGTGFGHTGMRRLWGSFFGSKNDLHTNTHTHIRWRIVWSKVDEINNFEVILFVRGWMS